MVYFPNESGHREFGYFFIDGPAFLLVEATHVLLHRPRAWMDLQGMLGDLPRNARHVRGFPRKDVFVAVEKVDERALLFEGKCGSNAHRFVLGGPRVYEDFLRAFRWLEGPGRPLSVEHFFGDLPLDGGELSESNDCCGMTAALDLRLIGTLEGGADGDDPIWSWHLHL